ncbi:HTH-type transcriptional regulator BetI [Peptococcaceae bacterium CEB3]|nr:HTH-type transcriptional regulator BetI [Peptococcaceae bacterium CEB3]
MPRTEEANQQIRDTQRANILEAAWKVFAQKGRAMTMADVAEAAQISYGLTYRYFDSKEAILQALVEQTLHSEDAFSQRFALPWTPGERLDKLIAQLVETRRDHPEFAQVHYQVLSDAATPPDLREQALRYAQRFHDLLRRLIVEGQAEGSVRAADPDQLVTAVMAALDGLTRLALIDPERFQAHFPDARIIQGMLKPSRFPRTKKKVG